MLIKTTHAHLLDGTEELLVEVTFQDLSLGDYQVSFMGGNVRNLHAGLAEIIEKYPQLCGQVAKEITTETISVPGYDPGKAGLN
jgi:hypothetical protein